MLPIYQSQSKEMSLMQTNWASQLNPLLSLPLTQGLVLSGVVLAVGYNSINHTLGRKLQGWFMVRQRSAASFYDDQDNEKNPSLILKLHSDSIVTVDLFVF